MSPPITGDEIEVDILPFCGLLVPADLFAEVGPVRRDLFMMGEEVEFCVRCRRAGRAVVLRREQAFRVQIDGRSDHYPPWRGYYQARNGVILARELSTGSDVLSGVWRQVRLLVGAATIRDGRWQRVCLRARGILDGLRGVSGCTVRPD